MEHAHLPQPDGLSLPLILDFSYGDQQFVLICTACSIRKLACPESGKEGTWIYCRGVQSFKFDEPAADVLRLFLFPIDFVTRARPGKTLPPMATDSSMDVHIFAMDRIIPQEALPISEVQRALTYCRGLAVTEPLEGRMYNDLVGKISRQFQAAISGMEAVYNFEYGDEFEVALCKVLRNILPQNFGICRGYVLNSVGDRAGDDIIIFDRMRFPTFRGLEGNDYSLKEQVPIEAIYAYIEVKHTLDIRGNHGSSLSKAVQQVSNVKMACAHRRKVPFEEIVPYVGLRSNVSIEHRTGWPRYRNPIYGAIISKNVRISSDRPLENDGSAIASAMAEQAFLCKRPPDLIIAGPNNINIPAIPKIDSEERWTPSPFFVESQDDGNEAETFNCGLQGVMVEGIAFGIGLGMLLWALDWIHLGEMPWPAILTNAVKPFCTPDASTAQVE